MGRGIKDVRSILTGEIYDTIPPCGMSSIFFNFLKNFKKIMQSYMRDISFSVDHPV
jgi:hypothetical protein